ncbi:multicopper oxidase family protein [Streptomyces scabiei]|uniref:multicopper oxidase family protein n=2 Tax=Streptomyces scabiei TaxID=1930 RepID=UPI001FF086B2|nr:MULTISPECIES: multicopper oxidase family protein [Streptomyces]MDW8471039.1 multicopper oxidase family protein [Streptomyces scabiei]MDX2567814.1 multicopper oxidase family protein [Streptomyces scabiei]MDX2628790.1 multicopper oxidase family protein [Streptomyces scabiei]MDX3147014.1 multicopper oxidase family protein [Streptomyces scabiei]MDX3155249.1 multicopper oxidase family protein [Streptomyces scabiei]
MSARSTARSIVRRSRIARLGVLTVGAALVSSFLAGCESAHSNSAAHGKARPADERPLPTTKQQAAGMVPGAALVEPPDLNAATSGDVTVQLTAAKKEVMISGKKVLAETYNGSLVGPTIHAVPGQRVTLKLKNKLDTATNLHYHGMHLSPKGSADNIMLSAKPGQTLTYHLDIPANQAPGTYWYHDHEMCTGDGESMPGMETSPGDGDSMPEMEMSAAPAEGRCNVTETQIGAGLSGTIIVGDSRASLSPAYRGITAHTLALKDAQISGSSSIVYPDGVLEPASPTVRLVNGQYRPTLNVKAGETQLWRIANEGYAILYDLQLDGGSFTVINQDGNPSAAPTRATHLRVPPGRRFDVLVTAGAPGSTWLRTLAHETGPEGDGDSYPDTTLMKVSVRKGGGSAGSAATGGPAGMVTSPEIAGPLPGSEPDLSGEPIAQSRRVALSDDGGNNFWINGKLFDMKKPTFKKPATLGTVEEWTLTNTSHHDHPFHLHIAPFQFLSVNGRAQPPADYMDTVSVPHAVDGKAGKVVIRIRFTDFTGMWMFHCHITGHEDNGMMGYVNVVAADRTG